MQFKTLNFDVLTLKCSNVNSKIEFWRFNSEAQIKCQSNFDFSNTRMSFQKLNFDCYNLRKAQILFQNSSFNFQLSKSSNVISKLNVNSSSFKNSNIVSKFKFRLFNFQKPKIYFKNWILTF